MPVKLARLLRYITINCCFDSHPRIDSVLQNSGFRYGLLENAILTAPENFLAPEGWESISIAVNYYNSCRSIGEIAVHCSVSFNGSRCSAVKVAT
ncbi:MAG: hypothetical protein ACK5HO_03445 [Pseudomonadota bacterium]